MSETSYRLATYAASDGTPRAGIVVDERIVDVSSSVLDVLRSWREFSPKLKQIARATRRSDSPQGAIPLSSVRLLAPILHPGAIFCAGANYKDHVLEMSRALNLPPEPDPHELGLKPWHFIKLSAQCVRATGSSIALPAYSSKVDWEAEIAVVMGRECRNVGIGEALDYVAGLTIANDLSARDHLKREGISAESPFKFDWVSQKCFDGALPLGPWICPLDEAGDTGNLRIRLWVNEELMQDSSSSNLIFSMAEQISHLSTRLTLMPGDVIATGTPAGCGAARGRFLKAGDRVRIWVQNIGELTTDFT
jgi:2-keto-4-pentenoate hydratase/2-oxohepta-3-ene-1,7-dioic acid hydratase in catechol pathway